mmetsp:Transcript_135973/g.434970  ORF Transcript_135973/g.434970 Transcript_135973/m.434970 type:complete len:283 (+) Transcript_135973:899-1747(+)
MKRTFLLCTGSTRPRCRSNRCPQSRGRRRRSRRSSTSLLDTTGTSPRRSKSTFQPRTVCRRLRLRLRSSRRCNLSSCWTRLAMSCPKRIGCTTWRRRWTRCLPSTPGKQNQERLRTSLLGRPHTFGESLTARRMFCQRCNSSTRPRPTRRLYQLRKWCRRTIDSSASTCPTGRTCRCRRSRPRTCQPRSFCRSSTQGMSRSLPSTQCSRPRWCDPRCWSTCRAGRARKRSPGPTRSPWGKSRSPDRKSMERRSSLLRTVSIEMHHLLSSCLHSRPRRNPRSP